MRTKKIKGKHFIFDLYGCDYHELDSPEGLERLMTNAALAARMEILHVHFHKFTPHGVTGVVLLSTSHISVHTWPEYGYAAFDVFSCSDEDQTRKAVDYITENLTHRTKRIKGVDRGYAELQTIDIPIYKNNTKQTVKVHKKLAEIKSPFQRIQVLDLEDFGKTLLIDGITQVSETDTDIYDEAITRELSERDQHILVLGGGDGFVAGKIIEKNPNAQVTVVELDPEVVYCARTYFDQGPVFDHPRVKLVIGDAMQFLKTSAEDKSTYDGIILDLTDNPVGGGKALTRLESFYNKLVNLSAPLLKQGGWISSQAGVRSAQRPLITTYEVLLPLFKKNFRDVHEETILIPSFLEENVFLYARKG